MNNKFFVKFKLNIMQVIIYTIIYYITNKHVPISQNIIFCAYINNNQKLLNFI